MDALSYLGVNFCSLPFITATADGPKHIETTLTRVKFEELCSDLLDRYIHYNMSCFVYMFSYLGLLGYVVLHDVRVSLVTHDTDLLN